MPLQISVPTVSVPAGTVSALLGAQGMLPTPVCRKVGKEQSYLCSYVSILASWPFVVLTYGGPWWLCCFGCLVP